MHNPKRKEQREELFLYRLLRFLVHSDLTSAEGDVSSFKQYPRAPYGVHPRFFHQESVFLRRHHANDHVDAPFTERSLLFYASQSSIIFVAARHSTVFGINSRHNHWATRLRSAVLAPLLENVLEVGSCFIIRSLSLRILALPRSILEPAEELIKPKHSNANGRFAILISSTYIYLYTSP